ncbi:MAG: hypothetical protein HFJ54_05395 [Clostridia bacterium]|nr:hypothetical protein [Clostridia bacterium]
MANSLMRKQFCKSIRNGVKSEKEQAEHVRKVRQSILEHKYGGLASRDEEERKKKEAKGELENVK